MLNLKYYNNESIYKVELGEKSLSTVELIGSIPVNNSGFTLSRIGKLDNWDYEEYRTLYKQTKNSLTYSNDGSVYTKNTTIKAVWNDDDNYDKLRPNEIEITVYRDGIKFVENIKLNEANNWQHTFTDTVKEHVYDIYVDADIPEYSFTCTGTTVTFKHTSHRPEPVPAPSVDELIAALQDAVIELDERVYNIEEEK